MRNNQICKLSNHRLEAKQGAELIITDILTLMAAMT